MDPERMAVVAGWDDTKSALARWHGQRYRIVGRWLAASLAVGVMLMLATWGVATYVEANRPFLYGGFPSNGSLEIVVEIIRRNLLVLAMHALVCVAGYMATSSVPIAANAYTGMTKQLHEWAGPTAIVFVTLATIGSLGLQAVAVGSIAPGVAAAHDRSIGELLLLITPHALPELAAIFLPLGAWLMLARQGRQQDLLAASILATAVALPLVIAAAFVEAYVTPTVLNSSFLQ